MKLVRPERYRSDGSVVGAVFEHPHQHRCRQCGQSYTGLWVESGYPEMGDCRCPEDRICADCEREVEG